MIRIVKALKAVPVTLADRHALTEEREQHEQVIGHLNVRWTRLAGAIGTCVKGAEEKRTQAGNQARSAEHDLGGSSLPVEKVYARLVSAIARRQSSDARLGKLWRWRRDIGGSVRARAAAFAKRVNEIDKILVSGVQEVSVEIRIDTEAGTAEMTRLDTGHVVTVHELTAHQRKKYAPPAQTAEDRTAPLPFPKTAEEEAKAAESEVIDEMPKGDGEEVAAEFAEFIHRGRSVDDRLAKEFGPGEARKIIAAIKAGEPGDLVIEAARARKAAKANPKEEAEATTAQPPVPPDEVDQSPADRAAAAFKSALPPKPAPKPRAKKTGGGK